MIFLKKIVFFFIISPCLVFAQNNIQLPKNVLKYYKLTEQAEESIIKNNKNEASKYYKEAFNIFNKPFSSDIYTSLIVNLDINNEDDAISDYLKLKCLNYKSSALQNSSAFKEFYIRNEQKINSYSCKNKLNFELKDQLDTLFFNDQNIRRALAFSKEIDKNKKIYICDSTNAKKVNALFEKHGFIGEYEIGAQEGSDFIFLNYLIIVLHQQQKDKKKAVDFEPILYKALMKGKLKNKNFIDLLGGMNSQKTGYSCFTLYKINNECCFVDKDIYLANRNEKAKITIASIEKKRAQIGLNSLDNALANKLYRLENSHYKLETEGVVTIDSPGFIDFLKANTLKITFEEFIKNRKW